METLSKHCKIPRCALEDGITGEANQLMALKTPLPHVRHSEGGATVETLSKHCKNPRCALEDVHDIKKETRFPKK